MHKPVDHWARVQPDAMAIHSENETLSYAELHSRIDAKVKDIQAKESSELLSIIATPSIESIVNIWAAEALGRSIALLSPKDPPEHRAHIREHFRLDQPSAISNDGMTILFSSGSTRMPKAICQHWSQHAASAEASQALIPLQPSDQWILSLPLFHIAGFSIVTRCFTHGATLVLADDPISAVLAPRSQITHISCVPTQLMRLLQAPATPQIKTVLCGGAPATQELLASAGDWPLYYSYGATELGSQICTGKVNATTPLSCGEPLPHIDLYCDESQKIWVKGSSLAKGLYNGRSIEPLPLNSDGFWDTGDLGELRDGHLYILGRADNRFISGGENIYPSEIEDELLKHPEITQAKIQVIEHFKYGKQALAIIERPQSLSDEEVMDFLSIELPRYKVPRRYLDWDKASESKPMG